MLPFSRKNESLSRKFRSPIVLNACPGTRRTKLLELANGCPNRRGKMEPRTWAGRHPVSAIEMLAGTATVGAYGLAVDPDGATRSLAVSKAMPTVWARAKESIRPPILGHVLCQEATANAESRCGHPHAHVAP